MKLPTKLICVACGEPLTRFYPGTLEDGIVRHSPDAGCPQRWAQTPVVAKVRTTDGDTVEVYDDGTSNPAILIRDADGPEAYAVLNSDQADAILAALARAVHISIPALKEEPHPWPCEKVAGHRHDKEVK